jgi:Raf kinase inhibitor-like YbhB/YbcL family protein
MKISIPIEKGFLPDKYGKYAPVELQKYGHAICSFPITIENVPEKAQSLAVSFIDYDSTPVCGFTWIHWIMCGIKPDTTLIPEGASQDPQPEWRQGFNSTFGNLSAIDEDLTVAQAYVGPCPPDMDHTYTLRVYALDIIPDLSEGFFYNQFHWTIKDHILEVAEIDILSRS